MSHLLQREKRAEEAVLKAAFEDRHRVNSSKFEVNVKRQKTSIARFAVITDQNVLSKVHCTTVVMCHLS